MLKQMMGQNSLAKKDRFLLPAQGVSCYAGTRVPIKYPEGLVSVQS